MKNRNYSLNKGILNKRVLNMSKNSLIDLDVMQREQAWFNPE